MSMMCMPAVRSCAPDHTRAACVVVACVVATTGRYRWPSEWSFWLVAIGSAVGAKSFLDRCCEKRATAADSTRRARHSRIWQQLCVQGRVMLCWLMTWSLCFVRPWYSEMRLNVRHIAIFSTDTFKQYFIWNFQCQHSTSQFRIPGHSDSTSIHQV